MTEKICGYCSGPNPNKTECCSRSCAIKLGQQRSMERKISQGKIEVSQINISSPISSVLSPEQITVTTQSDDTIIIPVDNIEIEVSSHSTLDNLTRSIVNEYGLHDISSTSINEVISSPIPMISLDDIVIPTDIPKVDNRQIGSTLYNRKKLYE